MTPGPEPAPRQPDGMDSERRARRAKTWRALFALSGLLPLLFLLASPPDPTLLIYSIFVLSMLARQHLRPLQRVAHLTPGRQRLLFLGLLFLSATFAETLVWLGEYLSCSEEPALLHPQLVPDVILGWGFYMPWGLSWLLISRFYRFGLRGTVLTQGAFGILLEQQGAILIAGLMAMPLGLLLWLYAGIVYGSILGIPMALTQARVVQRGPREHWIKYPLVLVTTAILVLALGGLWGLAVDAVGLVPPPRNICRHPLW